MYVRLVKMKTSARIAIKGGVLGVALAILAVIMVRSLFLIWQMPNDTMQPLVGRNDIIVATKWFHASALRSGDLVVVYVPTPLGNFPNRSCSSPATGYPGGQILRGGNEYQWC